MTSVRTVVHPGWVEVSGAAVHAVVAVGDRHVETLAAAAVQGLLPLLEALTAHGIAQAPEFVIAAPGDAVLRVLVRGSAVAVLADGTRLGSQGRMPWADLDVDLADAGDTVVLEAPEPPLPRGWRRPARLSRDTGAQSAAADPDRSGTPAVDEPDTAAADQAGAGAAPQPELTLPPPDDAGLPPAARVPAPPPARGGLIDAVPWRRGGGSSTPGPDAEGLPPTAAMPVLPPPDDPEPSSVEAPSHVEAASPSAATEPPEGTSPAEESAASPEHAVPDTTTDRGSLHTTDDDLDPPLVLAVLCPAGHPSPPHAGRCRTCDREIPPQQPFQTPRPSLGVLRVSTGGVVPLDRGVLLGRAPRVNEELPANQRPHLLRVGGVDRDISRNHAEVVLEGWHVLVRDLGSTNGTTVTLPGQEPVRLRPTEDHGIEPGTVVTLADEVSLTYEVDE